MRKRHEPIKQSLNVVFFTELEPIGSPSLAFPKLLHYSLMVTCLLVRFLAGKWNVSFLAWTFCKCTCGDSLPTFEYFTRQYAEYPLATDHVRDFEGRDQDQVEELCDWIDQNEIGRQVLYFGADSTLETRNA